MLLFENIPPKCWERSSRKKLSSRLLRRSEMIIRTFALKLPWLWEKSNPRKPYSRLYMLYKMRMALFAVVQRMGGYDKKEYYRIINVPTFHSFEWVGEELPDNSIALLNPSFGWSYVAISGHYAYTSNAYPWGMEQAIEISNFLLDGATDTDYIRKRNLDVLYSPLPLNNPDLVEVRPGVYILREGS